MVLFFGILVPDLAPPGRGHTFVYLRSFMFQVLSFLINPPLCAFRYSKLQEDIFLLVGSAQIILHIGHRPISMTTVLCNQIGVAKGPDSLESTLEAYHLCAIWLLQCHGKNTQKAMPQIPHLFPLPMRNLPVGFFGHKEFWLRLSGLPSVVKSLMLTVFLEKALDPGDGSPFSRSQYSYLL